MKTLRTPEEEATKRLHRYLMGAGIFCILLAGVQVVPSIFIRQTEIVTITRVDAARECRSRRAYKIWPKYRSSIPQNSIEFCGLIMSDHGSFELPETTWISLFRVSREDFFDGLVEGCRYRILVTGPGLELAEGRGTGMSNRNRTLRRLDPLGDCPSLESV